MNKLHFLFFLIPITLSAQWSQLGTNINGDNTEDLFGKSVSLNNDGTRIAVGAYYNDTNAEDAGQVKVFEYVNDNWNQVGQDILGQFNEDYTGAVVALNNDGTILAIGSMGYGPNNTGRVSIYEEDNGSWNLLGNHIEGVGNSFFGQQLKLNADGTRVIIAGASASGNGNVNNGRVRVYSFNGTDWDQLGQDFWGDGLAVFLGTRVAVNDNGNRIAMTAPMRSGAAGNNAGGTFIYELTGNTWTQLGQVLEGTSEFQEFGRGLSMDGTGEFIAVGSAYFNLNTGKAQAYKLVNGSWIPYGQELVGDTEGEYFGIRLDFNNTGNILAVSAPFNSNTGFIRGSVKVYEDQNENWAQLGDNIYGEANEDGAGLSLSISDNGTRLAVGSLYFDGPGGSDAGHARVFNYETLSIDDVINADFVTIFPNPTSNNCTISLGKIYSKADLKIFDVIGNVVFNEQLYNNDSFNISLDNLNSGMYLISISTKDLYSTSKLIKI